MKRYVAGVLMAGLALSSLLNVHLSPQTVVAAEGGMALAVVLAFALTVLSSTDGLALRVGWAGAVAAGLLLACLAWLPWVPGLGYAVYLGLFLICYALGAQMQDGLLAEAVAWGLLLCALLQSLAGLAQLAGWSLGGLVMPKMFLQAFGNVGQANHYADLIFLGLASLSFLWGLRRLNGAALALLALWLALAAAASASRGGLLYTAAFLALGGVSLWRGADDAQRRCGQALLVVAVCSVAAQLLVTYGHVLEVFGVTTALDRAGDAGSNGQRLYNWTAAWQAIQAHPWLGQGPASFYKASIDAMFTTPPASFPKFAEHAHNLPLNMAAELGVPVTLAAMGGLLWWYLRLWCGRPSALRLWALACVGVVGLHSMVEYPLWYTYFLAPMGLVMGLADGAEGRLPVLRVPRWLALGLATLALGVLVWVAHDWFAVRAAYSQLAAEEPSPALETRLLARLELNSVSRFSVFDRHAETLRLQSWHPDEGGAARIAARCEATWPYKPGWYLMMRCGEAYALAGRAAELKHLVVAMCDGFPAYRPELNDWARQYDAAAKRGLRIGGRACLR